MRITEYLTHIYAESKANKWMHYFAVFCRVMLALAFLIAGYVKISGERFASGLPVNNPMGHYLEALYHTEFYYTFIGIGQWIIALLLLIRRTRFLGALLYFPVILNICILAYALRFEGTRITTFMVLANAYLLCWDFDKLKKLLPLKHGNASYRLAEERPLSNRFPYRFFGLVLATLATVVILNLYIYDIRPGNSPEECINGCPGNADPAACEQFCNCIYKEGKSLHECLEIYHAAAKKKK